MNVLRAQIMWESPSDWTDKFFKQELEAHVPKVITDAFNSICML